MINTPRDRPRNLTQPKPTRVAVRLASPAGTAATSTLTFDLNIWNTADVPR